jgi:small-conductance mechanosensitive channel
MDALDKLDMAEQVAKVRARARPWRSIIALVLAAIAAAASVWAADQNHGGPGLTLAGHPVDRLLSAGCAVVFCLLALIATLGLSGKAREVLEPGIGSAHAAVVRYAIVLAGGVTSLLITLELLKVPVGNLILGGAFTAVLIGIAAQQTLGNLFAGIVLLVARPFAVGDSVRMRAGALSGEIEGTVTDIGITYVRLDTDQGTLNVPNSQVLAAAVGPVRQPGGTGPVPAVAPPTAAGQSAAAASAARSAEASQPAAPGQPAATSAAAVAPFSEESAPQHAGPGGADRDGERGSQR